MRRIFGALAAQLDLGRGAVLCTIADSRGSTPRGAGARMLVTAEGDTAGTVGGGAVEAKVSGKKEVVSIAIKPEAVDPEDVEMLQDMVVAAVNEAMRAAEDDAANAMKGLTGGLGLGM